MSIHKDSFPFLQILRNLREKLSYVAEQLGDHIWLHHMEMQSLYFKNKIFLFNFNNLLVFRIHVILIILQTKGLPWDENLFWQWEHLKSSCSWHFLCFLNSRTVQNSWLHSSHFNSDALTLICLFRWALSWKVFLQVGHACWGGWDFNLCCCSCFNEQKISEQILQLVFKFLECLSKFDFLSKVSWQSSHW